MTYVAWGIAAKKCAAYSSFDVPGSYNALAERGNAEYRDVLIGCECGIPSESPNVFPGGGPHKRAL